MSPTIFVQDVHNTALQDKTRISLNTYFCALLSRSIDQTCALDGKAPSYVWYSAARWVFNEMRGVPLAGDISPCALCVTKFSKIVKTRTVVCITIIHRECYEVDNIEPSLEDRVREYVARTTSCRNEGGFQLGSCVSLQLLCSGLYYLIGGCRASLGALLASSVETYTRECFVVVGCAELQPTARLRYSAIIAWVYIEQSN